MSTHQTAQQLAKQYGIGTSTLNNIRIKAEQGVAMDTPTTGKQAVYNAYQQHYSNEVTRKAKAGISLDSPNAWKNNIYTQVSNNLTPNDEAYYNTNNIMNRQTNKSQNYLDSQNDLLQQNAKAQMQSAESNYAKIRDQQISDLQGQLDQAVADGKMSVQEAETAFNKQKEAIYAQNYLDSEYSKAQADNRGIQNSQQFLGMEQTRQANTTSLLNNNMTDRDNKIFQINNRLAQLNTDTLRGMSQARTDYGYNVAGAQADINAQTFQNQFNMGADEYNRLQNLQGQLDQQGLQQKYTQANMATDQQYTQSNMEAQQGYNLQNMAIQQQYTRANMATEQQYNKENLAIQQKYALQQMNQQQKHTLQQFATQQGYDLQKMSIGQQYSLAQMAQQYGYDLGLQTNQQNWQTNERVGSQNFTANQNALDRTWQTNERVGSQNFSSNQNALDRQQQTNMANLDFQQKLEYDDISYSKQLDREYNAYNVSSSKEYKLRTAQEKAGISSAQTQTMLNLLSDAQISGLTTRMESLPKLSTKPKQSEIDAYNKQVNNINTYLKQIAPNLYETFKIPTYSAGTATTQKSSSNTGLKDPTKNVYQNYLNGVNPNMQLGGR